MKAIQLQKVSLFLTGLIFLVSCQKEEEVFERPKDRLMTPHKKIEFKSDGGLNAQRMLQTQHHELIFLGSNSSNSKNTLNILKTDIHNKKKWETEIGELIAFEGRTLEESPNQELYVTKNIPTSSNEESYETEVTKLTANGSILWKKTLPNTSSNYTNLSLATKDLGLLVATFKNDTRFKYQTILELTKLNREGTILWKKEYPDDLHEFIFKLLETNNGEIVICGTNPSNRFVSNNSFVFKITSDGELVWRKDLGFEYNYPVINDIILLENGKLFIVGETLDRDLKESQLWSMLCDPEGNTIRVNNNITFPANGNLVNRIVINDIYVKSSDEIYLGGEYIKSYMYNADHFVDGDGFILKVNQNGDEIWKSMLYSSDNSSHIFKLVYDPNKDRIIGVGYHNYLFFAGVNEDGEWVKP